MNTQFDLETAERLVRAIVSAAGDEEVTDRIAAVRSTYQRITSHEPVTGCRRLKELIRPEVVEAASKWLGTSPEEGIASEVHHLTDLGNAKRFARQHREHLRYRHPRGDWVVWKGKYWIEDQITEIFRFAGQTARSIYVEAANEADNDKRSNTVKWAKTSESVARIKAMIELASSEPELSALAHEFDRDPMLLNCVNGTVDLATGRLREHRRTDLITKIVPVEFTPSARCPRWMGFLKEITVGRVPLQSFLQRAVGYTLTGHTREQVLFFLLGSGANGKSTFLETVRTMLGDYAAQSDFSTLLSGAEGRVRNDLARLLGRRLVTAVEVGHGQHLAEVIVKQVTGEDTVTTRFLYKEYFEYRPQFKLFIAANHFPHASGEDDAFWRRIIVVPFDVSIPEARRDKTLMLKLRDELPGILAWAVEGCIMWQREGLNPAMEVLNASRASRDDQDSIGGFLKTCCVFDSQKITPAGELYAAYREFCSDMGHFCEKQKRFGSSLGKRGLESRRHGESGRYAWIGIGLKKYRDAASLT
jgi:putative DNA primase/helicase